MRRKSALPHADEVEPPLLRLKNTLRPAILSFRGLRCINPINLLIRIATVSRWSLKINFFLPVTALPETASNRATSSSEVICTKCNCSKSTVLASVITALVTALLAAVIFGAVQVAICKCCPNFTRPRARTVPLVEREGPGYKQMDDDKEGTAISEPTYTEVGPGGESTATPFTIKNEAYGITTRS